MTLKTKAALEQNTVNWWKGNFLVKCEYQWKLIIYNHKKGTNCSFLFSKTREQEAEQYKNVNSPLRGL